VKVPRPGISHRLTRIRDVQRDHVPAIGGTLVGVLVLRNVLHVALWSVTVDDVDRLLNRSGLRCLRHEGPAFYLSPGNLKSMVRINSAAHKNSNPVVARDAASKMRMSTITPSILYHTSLPRINPVLYHPLIPVHLVPVSVHPFPIVVLAKIRTRQSVRTSVEDVIDRRG